MSLSLPCRNFSRHSQHSLRLLIVSAARPHQQGYQRLGQKLTRRYASSSAPSSTLSVTDKKSSTTRPKQQLPPLAALPTGVLLRSLLVAGVSSHGFLLRPALWVLSLLSRPNLPWLFSVDRNPLLHMTLRRTLYDQFCAGEGVVDTRKCVQQLKDLGFRGVILTYARETVFDVKTGQGVSEVDKQEAATAECPDIQEWKEGTLKTLELIDEGDILAIKLTGTGQAANAAFHRGEMGPQQLMDALNEICSQCRDKGVTVIVDAESQHVQKGITRVGLELMRRFNRDGHFVVWNTYQAYLKATPALLEEHLAAAERDNFTIGLKLVRGAYLQSDPRHLIHDTKSNTDDAYNSIAQGALRQELGQFGIGQAGQINRPFPSAKLFLAGHNRHSVLEARRLHLQRTKAGLPTLPVAFGQLHGMADAVSFALLRDGVDSEDSSVSPPDVYKCSTWGSLGECLGYLVRRAAENRDAVMRTADEYAALKTETWRRMRSVFGL